MAGLIANLPSTPSQLRQYILKIHPDEKEERQPVSGDPKQYVHPTEFDREPDWNLCDLLNGIQGFFSRSSLPSDLQCLLRAVCNSVWETIFANVAHLMHMALRCLSSLGEAFHFFEKVLELASNLSVTSTRISELEGMRNATMMIIMMP